MKFFLLINILFLLACNQATEQVNQQTVSTKDTNISETEVDTSAQLKRVSPHQEFLDFYSAFITSIQKASVGENLLNNYIHPVHGLYIISNHNGAMPTINRYLNLAEIENDEATKQILFGSCAEIEKKPTFESLPKIVCDEDIYDKIGCFAEDTNTLAESGIWNYGNLNEKEKQAIQFAAESVNITVINTFFFTFYFSKTDEGYKVTFIDIRTPCSA